MKPKAVRSVRSAARCEHLTPNGRQCRSLPASTSALCPRHAAAQEYSDTIDHSAVLTRFSRGFQTVEGINFALGDLFVLLAQGRISPRRAAVLTYMASLMLRTLPAMHKNPGKYNYRLIGATEIPPQEPDEDEEGETDQDELDAAPENMDAHENVNLHESTQEEETKHEAKQPELMLKPIATVPPGKTPLPTTREAFLNAVDDARVHLNNGPKDEPDK